MKQENRCTYQIRVLSGFSQIPKICWILVCEILSPKMFKQILVLLCVWLSISLNAQVINSQSLESVGRNKQNTSFNLEEIKVRWKKAALENCPGVPCITITVPGAPTGVVATAGNAFASVAFVAPTSNGGSAITGYTVTSNPGSISATGASSPINITGLINGTAYTFTVVATNAVGNSVPSAASLTVTPSFTCGTSTVTDVDGNAYNTKLIGSQCWTTTNLKVTKYNDGSVIGDSTNSTWGTAVIGARTENKENSASPSSPSVSGYVGTLGYLYNWYAATDSRKLCPDGWHVPTDAEWTIMIQQLDNMAPPPGFTGYGPQSNTAGTVMKSTTTNSTAGSGLGWNPVSPPSAGTNTSGFSGLPGGYRQSGGGFNGIRNDAFFWSATENFINTAWYRSLFNSNGDVSRNHITKSVGASVRCLKNS